MLAGHALLKILCGFVFLFLTAGSSWWFIGFLLNVVVVSVLVLEIMISFLQAYVFTLLSVIYLNEAVNLH
jgi:F0F1-type ATP synthase membrane subunit a